MPSRKPFCSAARHWEDGLAHGSCPYAWGAEGAAAIGLADAWANGMVVSSTAANAATERQERVFFIVVLLLVWNSLTPRGMNAALCGVAQQVLSKPLFAACGKLRRSL